MRWLTEMLCRFVGGMLIMGSLLNCVREVMSFGRSGLLPLFLFVAFLGCALILACNEEREKEREDDKTR